MNKQGTYKSPFDEKNIIAAMIHNPEEMARISTMLGVSNFKVAGEKLADIAHAYWMATNKGMIKT